MAQRFSKVLRKDDVLARLGGDEFIVLLNDIEDPHAATLLQKKSYKYAQNPFMLIIMNFS